MHKTFDLENSLLPYIGKTAKFMDFYFMDAFLENGFNLSKEQWLMLKVLHLEDGQIQNDLAFITNRSKTSLTRLITTMEKKGLVYRLNSKVDKRINHIYLSDTGKSYFAKSEPIIKKIKKELQENISKKDIEKTIEVLKQIQANINKKVNIS